MTTKELNVYLRAFRAGTAVMALIPLLTGLGGIVEGICFNRIIEASIPEALCEESTLNNQVRFVWTMWFGYAPMIALCLSDIPRFAPVACLVLVCAFCGGFVRLFSVVQLGIPMTPFGRLYIFGAIFLELVVVSGLGFLLRCGLSEKNKAS